MDTTRFVRALVTIPVCALFMAALGAVSGGLVGGVAFLMLGHQMYVALDPEVMDSAPVDPTLGVLLGTIIGAVGGVIGGVCGRLLSGLLRWGTGRLTRRPRAEVVAGTVGWCLGGILGGMAVSPLRITGGSPFGDSVEPDPLFVWTSLLTGPIGGIGGAAAGRAVVAENRGSRIPLVRRLVSFLTRWDHLTPVANLATQAEAERVRAQLDAQGIRYFLAGATLHRAAGALGVRPPIRLQAIREDAERAWRILSGGCMPTELVAAGAPEGSGTEPEAAGGPVGLGTELEAADTPPDDAPAAELRDKAVRR